MPLPVIIGGAVIVAYILAGWVGLNEWVYIWTKGVYHPYQGLFLLVLFIGLLVAFRRPRTAGASWTGTVLIGAGVGYLASAAALLFVPLFMAAGPERFAATVRDGSTYVRVGGAALTSGGWLVGLGAAWLAEATVIRYARRLRLIIAISVLGALIQATAFLVGRTMLLRF